MGCDLEPLTFAVRAGESYVSRAHSAETGQPFDFSATLQIMGDFAEVKAAHGKLTARTFRELIAEIAKLPINRLLFDRYKPVGVRRIWAFREPDGSIRFEHEWLHRRPAAGEDDDE